jgi:lipoate-protein ligase A
MANKNFLPKSLHHGTIMLNVNIENMNNYLNPNKLKLISKGVDSVKSRVVNLCDIYPNLNLNKELIYEVFEKEFIKYLNIDEYNKIIVEDENSDVSKENNSKVYELFNKYSSWDWLYGECPEFSNSLFHKFDFGLIDLSMIVEKGMNLKYKAYII